MSVSTGGHMPTGRGAHTHSYPLAKGHTFTRLSMPHICQQQSPINAYIYIIYI